MTRYSKVTADNTDVLAFLCRHVDKFNVYHLPVAMWVAKDETGIVALLMLKTMPYTSLDLIVADPDSRPFMRIYKLWKMAETWLKAHDVPMIATSVFNHLAHYQTMVQRMGFEKIGEELNDDGVAVETIFGKQLREVHA